MRTNPESYSHFAALTPLLAEAKKSGLVRYELEARMALAEMEVKSGKEVGRADLAALRNGAKAKGFELIAKKTQRYKTRTFARRNECPLSSMVSSSLLCT